MSGKAGALTPASQSAAPTLPWSGNSAEEMDQVHLANAKFGRIPSWAEQRGIV